MLWLFVSRVCGAGQTGSRVAGCFGSQASQVSDAICFFLPHQETASTHLLVGRLPRYRRWVRDELGVFPLPLLTRETCNGIKIGRPFRFLVDKAMLEAVATDTHHFQDYCRGCDGLLEERFFCRLEFAARACARGGVLTAVLLTSLPSCAWKMKDTRETLEGLNIQLLCGTPAL